MVSCSTCLCLVLRNVEESSVYEYVVFSYPEIVANGNSFLSLNSGQFYWFLGWRILLPVNDLSILRMMKLVNLSLKNLRCTFKYTELAIKTIRNLSTF